MNTRNEISETGPGWAVLSWDDVPKPGRWATKADAEEYGLGGRYLLSGYGVIKVGA